MSLQRNRAATIVITGASTGIGEACAWPWTRRGYRVFAGVRNDADGRAAPRPGLAAADPPALGRDRRRLDCPGRRRVEDGRGKAGLAGLVNNAGIVVAGPLELLPLDEVRKQFEVNVIGQIAVTQAFLPLLRRARGRIVNMGSLNGRIAAPYLGPYAASKHALEAMSDALRSRTPHLGDRGLADRAGQHRHADLGQVVRGRRPTGSRGRC